jgi:hypothetical protein
MCHESVRHEPAGPSTSWGKTKKKCFERTLPDLWRVDISGVCCAVFFRDRVFNFLLLLVL